MPILQVEDIHTYYGDAYVLHGVHLDVEQGECLGATAWARARCSPRSSAPIRRGGARSSSRASISPALRRSKPCAAAWDWGPRAVACFPPLACRRIWRWPSAVSSATVGT